MSSYEGRCTFRLEGQNLRPCTRKALKGGGILEKEIRRRFIEIDLMGGKLSRIDRFLEDLRKSASKSNFHVDY